MTIEPSDIVELLGRLAAQLEDPTCAAARNRALRGDPILTVCHEAIGFLAAEKAVLKQLLSDALAALPPKRA